jgi:hypothetical protein
MGACMAALWKAELAITQLSNSLRHSPRFLRPPPLRTWALAAVTPRMTIGSRHMLIRDCLRAVAWAVCEMSI